MTTPEQMVGIAAVLAHVAKRSGGVSGRVRLQKIVYLLKRQALPQLEPLWFGYHHYGPYSDELAGILSQAVRAQIVTEQREDVADEWQRYEYKVGPRAEEYGNLLAPEQRSVVDGIVEAARGQHWRTLELAATIDYLRGSEGVGFDAAVQHALVLKPACKPYEGAARTLLRSLGLERSESARA